MTRFWLTLGQGVRFVIRAIERMEGGEVFVPKIPSMRLVDLAAAIAPGCAIQETGIRSGEKLHEVLVSDDEARTAREFDDMYVVRAASQAADSRWNEGRPLADGFRYASDTNTVWLSAAELLQLAEIPYEPSPAEILAFH
jgi:UDP-N-acetylglucosamine 4,6-dehydratase